MIPTLERPEDFPGQQRVAWRREPQRIALAAVAGALWPPLVVTLVIWPPRNWLPGLEMDWRLVVLLIGLLAVPAMLWPRAWASSGASCSTAACWPRRSARSWPWDC
jgi:hypothetical protein